MYHWRLGGMDEAKDNKTEADSTRQQNSKTRLCHVAHDLICIATHPACEPAYESHCHTT